MTTQSVKPSIALAVRFISYLRPFYIRIVNEMLLITQNVPLFSNHSRKDLKGSRQFCRNAFTMTTGKTVCYVGSANVHTGKKRC